MYQTELEYTYSEYMKMQRRIYIKELIVILVIVIIGIIVGINPIGCVGLGILSILISFVISAIRIRRGWELDKKTDTIINKYTFLEHHFEVHNEKGAYNINYHDINYIIETKTHFYIRCSEYSNFIIKKENCTEELIQLIRKYKTI